MCVDKRLSLKERGSRWEEEGEEEEEGEGEGEGEGEEGEGIGPAAQAAMTLSRPYPNRRGNSI